MSIKQISVFLENKPGKLSEMTALLAENNIDLRALSLAETKDFGIARMIADDAFEAANVLKNGDFIANFSPVLAYAVPDEPGGLNKLLCAFNEAGVNIEYMYSFLGGNDSSHAYMIFRVADTSAAEAALAAKGLRAVSQEEIANI
ncbi:MAG: ACT domain-containing protein [Oscillospiraceae bacterium]|nr:ACT domain-containing protein [Oscillospiraceae bacterium]